MANCTSSQDAWFRRHNAAEQKRFRGEMQSLTLGVLVDWADQAGAVDIQHIAECLDELDPKEA
jgi:hypothetical protein